MYITLPVVGLNDFCFFDLTSNILSLLLQKLVRVLNVLIVGHEST